MAGRVSLIYRRILSSVISLSILLSGLVSATAQESSPQNRSDADSISSKFRIERLPIGNGGELFTVFGKLDPLAEEQKDGPEVPLISVLRDTLGDANSENDRLRYVWTFAYARPTLIQRAAAMIPFYYNRAGNRKRAARDVPAPIADLANPDKVVWQKIFWTALQSIMFDPNGFVVRASSRSYRRNIQDYRKAHIIRALAILSLYQAETGEDSPFNESEMRDIQARLMLTDKSLGGLVDDIYLHRFYEKQNTQALDVRGHNWELLRQRAEAEGLYFEPLDMPDGSTTHALLWAARSDLELNKRRHYNSRFLNIANPWKDSRLRRWDRYTETWYFDSENRRVDPQTPNTIAREMIPLAIYGLDHPKIPILLVDFRDGFNPKKREMSRRATEDIARNVLLVSRFGDLYYFLGRTVYDFVTGRRGADINQPSRLRAYSQLKLLISLSESIDPTLSNEISERIERVSLNPMENDVEVEARLAKQQYTALLEYARRPDGLPAQVERDRGEELVAISHGRAARVFFKTANILSFGLYTHRERVTEEETERLAQERSLSYHTRFLREVAASSEKVEIVWDINQVRRSLNYIAENSSFADAKTAKLAARLFDKTEDDATRALCLNCLYLINSESAKAELLQIYQNPHLDEKWRDISAFYLRLAVQEQQRIAPSDAKAVMVLTGQ